MRPFLCAFAVVVLAGLTGSPLNAAPKGGPTLVTPPPASGAALRGRQSPMVQTQPLIASGLRGSAPLFSPSPLAQDAGQCRHACAKPYFICLSDQGAAPDCPQAWTICVAACASPGA